MVYKSAAVWNFLERTALVHCCNTFGHWTASLPPQFTLVHFLHVAFPNDDLLNATPSKRKGCTIGFPTVFVWVILSLTQGKFWTLCQMNTWFTIIVIQTSEAVHGICRTSDMCLLLGHLIFISFPLPRHQEILKMNMGVYNYVSH